MAIPSGATPAERAIGIVDRLAGWLAHQPPAIAGMPAQFFQVLAGAEDIESCAADFEQQFGNFSGFAGRADFYREVLRACAHCAYASRLSGEIAWVAVVNAERHAGVVLAMLVATAEDGERKAVYGKKGSDARTEKNMRLRAYVIEEVAAQSRQTSIRSAVTNVVNAMASKGGLEGAIKGFGAMLKPDHDSLVKTFSGYVTSDMVIKGVLAEGGRASSEAFERWKESFR